MTHLGGTALHVALSDSEVVCIANAAGRLTQHLCETEVLESVNMCACIDDLLGAVHALFLARHHGFEDRAGKSIEVPVLKVRAVDLSGGRVRVEGKWAAGFYFNSALFRLAAVYHRLLKVVLDKPESREYLSHLQKEAQMKYQHWTQADWANLRIAYIHDEVNVLKHHSGGVYTTRRATFANAVQALTEIVVLIDVWLLHRQSQSPSDGR